MEDALALSQRFGMISPLRVLILVVMEDALALAFEIPKETTEIQS